MKKIICPFLILGLTLLCLTIGHAQETNLDTLRAADVNADGTIDILDVTFIASHFGKAVAADQIPNPDVTGDGIVNILDLVLVAGQMGKTVRPPVAFVSADPVMESRLEVNDTITLTFDSIPEDVIVSAGVATIADETVTIAGPFDPGDLALTVTWLDGTQTLTYTVRSPVAFVRARPAADATLDGDDTITLTFDRRPEDVTVSTGVAETTGRFVEITGPFDPGDLALTITWSDGSQTLTYVIRTPDTDAPRITGGTVSDGDEDIKPDVVNTRARIEIDFNEEVTGNITLQTPAGVDVGWIGEVDGKKGILELVKGKELDSGATYVIAGKVSDAAGNETDLNITFTTESRTSGIPFEVTDATFNTLVLGSEIPVLLEYVKDG